MPFLKWRCATGEAWPDIMLDATSGRECDPLAVDRNETTGKINYTNNVAFISWKAFSFQYLITTYSIFYHFNSRRKIWQRSTSGRKTKLWIHLHLLFLCFVHISMFIYYVESLCGCYYGQFWLLNKRLIHIGITSSRWIYFNLVGLWCEWNVSEISESYDHSFNSSVKI